MTARWKTALCLTAVTVLGLSACQTGPSMSLDEARDMAIAFRAERVDPPDRSIARYREKQSDKYVPFSEHCDDIRSRRVEKMEELARTVNQGNNASRQHKAFVLLRVAEETFHTGRFDAAITNTRKAYVALGPKGNQVRQAVMMTQLGRIQTAIGRYSDAQNSFATANHRWRGAGEGWMNKPRGLMMRASADASLARIDGDLPAEEFFLRRTLELLRQVGGSRSYHIDRDQLNARLAMNLIMQGRYVEAELAARTMARASLAPHTGGYPSILSYGAFAEALYAQGRFDDAAFLARVAVGSHHRVCALPDSVPLIEAWRTVLKATAAQGDWAGIDEAREILNRELSPARYEELFGANPDVLLARAVRGDVDGLRARIDRMLTRLIEEEGDDATSVRELRLVRAVTLQAEGRAAEAVTAFRDTLIPYLQTAHTATGATRTGQGEGRAEFFRRAYLSYLSKEEGRAAAVQAGLDPVAEMFRVATMVPSGSVQRAFTASSVRAAAKDPELAELVRRTQDVEEQVRNAEDLLTFLETSPEARRMGSERDTLRTQIVALNLAKSTLEQETVSRFPDYAELMNPATPDLAGVQAQLHPGEAALVVRTLGRATYVWAIPQSGEPAFAVVAQGTEELAARVSHIREALDPGAVQKVGDLPDFDLAAAHELYRDLLQPVESGWRSANSLLVVVHGPLGHLPFSLLPTAPGDLKPDSADGPLFAGYRDVPWLARTHAVTNLPSVASLPALRAHGDREQKAPRAFAGFGDPYFSRFQAADAKRELAAQRNVASAATARGIPIALRSAPDTRGVDSAQLSMLPRLPDTRPEIEAIADVLGAASNDVFLGERASETNARSGALANYRVISFATHGLVPGDLNGLAEPALALSSPAVTKNDRNDGLLTMGEILELDLNADWVVLSACNTAAADGRGAEAVSGLGRAFFYAGSRALLVSNWPVFSSSTTEMMTDLFRRLAEQEGLGRAEALRLSRTHLIDTAEYRTEDGTSGFSYAHPIFWAPFVVVGEGG